MFRKRFGSLFELASKSNVVNIILISNAFIWYYTVLIALQDVLEHNPAAPLLWVVHFVALIASAFVGAVIAKQVERSRFLASWMISGIGVSLILFALSSSSDIIVGLISLSLGATFGFGMPVCMSYFTDSVSIESRGRMSGITMLVSGVGIAVLGFVDEINFLQLGIVLGIWRLSSLLVFLWAKDYQKTVQKERVVSYREALTQRSFILYFVPWMMFSLVNYLAAPLEPSFGNDIYIPIVQSVCMAVAAISGGVFVDSVGRKRVAIAGFAMLGSATAAVGFLGNSLPVLYLNAVAKGIAWGFLLGLFVLTLWGDLSHDKRSEIYYALGVMPFFVSKLLEITIGGVIVQSISSYRVFSFTALFLFLAVLPLFFAPETLPEKVMKKQELKFYVEEAQEIAQKYS